MENQSGSRVSLSAERHISAVIHCDCSSSPSSSLALLTSLIQRSGARVRSGPTLRFELSHSMRFPADQNLIPGVCVCVYVSRLPPAADSNSLPPSSLTPTWPYICRPTKGGRAHKLTCLTLHASAAELECLFFSSSSCLRIGLFVSFRRRNETRSRYPRLLLIQLIFSREKVILTKINKQ